MSPSPFALSLRQGLDSLSDLRAALAQWLSDNGVSEEGQASIVLAAHEAAANAVQHANGTRAVVVRARLSDENVVVEIRDHGHWKPALFDDEERGRGLLLISALIQDVEIQTDKHGTTVRMQHPHHS